MNPVPLTDPTGTVRAWMCGRCNCIGEFNGETSEWHAEESRRSAERCCMCECGAIISKIALWCRDCARKRQAEIDAQNAEMRKTHYVCPQCNAARDDCSTCDGTGWVEHTPAQSTADAGQRVNAQSTSVSEREG